VEINGRYMAFSSSPPESQLKTVRLVFTGKLKKMNVPYETYGEIKTTVEEVPLDSELIVELGTPAQLTADLLPLKAKMADLTGEDLAGLSREQLAYVRNEIFARHGHTFKTEKMIAYFAQKEWYHTLVDDAQPLLNKFEKRNVDFIKKMEG
jgi:hypothetical protein